MDKVEFDVDSFEESLGAKNLFDGNLRFGAAVFHRDTNRSGKGKPASGGLVREHSKIVRDTGEDRYVRVGDWWEDVSQCPVCRSESRELFVKRMGLDIYRCLNCSHRYQHPRITFEKACELYADDKISSDIYTQPKQIDVDKIKYNYGIELIRQLKPPSNERILDIGCGTGTFLQEAYKSGWRKCVGIDANSRYSSMYNDTEGIQYISSSFEALDTQKIGYDYDCITLWNVLEHLYKVSDIVNGLSGLLKKGGLILIMVPNAESLATRLIREKSPTYNWKHVSHFTASSLKLLLGLNGFSCIRMETAISEIDNIKSYMSGEYPYEGHGDPSSMFSFITPEFIHKNMLGSRLIGVFRRD